MKSKTSYFNKSIFKKNLSLYWPLWASFLIVFIFGFTVMLELNFFRVDLFIDKDTLLSNRMLNLADFLNTPVFEVVIFGYSILFAMALFGYLFNSRSANMIHSLPVTRDELFFTNYFSGILFMVVPEAITFILSVLVCISNGITQVQYLAIWLLYMVVATVLFYSIAIFCCFLTGQLLVVPIFYLLINFFYPMLTVFTAMLISHTGYGIDFNTVTKSMGIPMVCPVEDMPQLINFKIIETAVNVKGENYTFFTGFEFHGWWFLLIYFLISFVFAGLALLMYKKRAIECAQDFLSFEFLKPIFRWGVGIVLGYAGAIGIFLVLISFDIVMNGIVQFVLILLLAVCCFFFADMFVQKGFRIFTKKRMKECAAFAIFTVLCIIGVNFGTDSMEKSVPKKEAITSASLEINGWYLFDESDLDAIISIQKELIDHRKEFRYYDNLSSYEEGSNTVTVTYCLKNGSLVNRCYNVPYSDTGKSIISNFLAGIDETEVFMNAFMGFRQDRLAGFDGGYMEVYNKSEDCYENLKINTEAAETIYNALVKDIKAGNFQKYNSIGLLDFYGNENDDYYLGNYDDEEAEATRYYENIYLSVFVSSENVSVYYEAFGNGVYSTITNISNNVIDYSCTYTVELYISFGEDCTNLVNALIEEGFIESSSDLTLNRTLYVDKDEIYYKD